MSAGTADSLRNATSISAIQAASPTEIVPAWEQEMLDSRIEKSCVLNSASLLGALRAISDGTLGMALVTDRGRKLLGVLADGDIRRALLGGATLESPVGPFVNRRFVSVGPSDDRTFVLDLMQSRSISQVPILRGDGTLIGMHLLREILGVARKPNWAVIMAGGLGTRLRPITETIPKPMIKVAGRPILERLLLHLVGYGIRRVFLSLNYLGHVIEDYFGDGQRVGCEIQYLREKEPMGTGGALALLPGRPQEPLLVLNGDLVTQPRIDGFLDFHNGGGYAATIAVRTYLHQVPFGCVEVAQNCVRSFAEKPMIEQMINAGAYILSPKLLERIPSQFYPITRLFDECLERGEAVGAWEIAGDWLDVGQKEQLKQAQEGTA